MARFSFSMTLSKSWENGFEVISKLARQIYRAEVFLCVKLILVKAQSFATQASPEKNPGEEKVIVAEFMIVKKT